MVDMIAQKKLWSAAAAGDQATIRALANSDIDFDARDEEDRTAFNIATQYNRPETAQTILAMKQARAMRALGMVSPGYVEETTRRTGT